MLVEQLVKEIQNLIKNGTISPTTKIEIRGTVGVCDNECSDIYCVDFRTTDIAIKKHESSYNLMILYANNCK